MDTLHYQGVTLCCAYYSSDVTIEDTFGKSSVFLHPGLPGLNSVPRLTDTSSSLQAFCHLYLVGLLPLEPFSSPAVKDSTRGLIPVDSPPPVCRVTGLRQWEALIEGRRAGGRSGGRGFSPSLHWEQGPEQWLSPLWFRLHRASSSCDPHPISILPPTGGWGSSVLLLFFSRSPHCPLFSFSALL